MNFLLLVLLVFGEIQAGFGAVRRPRSAAPIGRSTAPAGLRGVPAPAGGWSNEHQQSGRPRTPPRPQRRTDGPPAVSKEVQEAIALAQQHKNKPELKLIPDDTRPVLAWEGGPELLGPVQGLDNAVWVRDPTSGKIGIWNKNGDSQKDFDDIQAVFRSEGFQARPQSPPPVYDSDSENDTLPGQVPQGERVRPQTGKPVSAKMGNPVPKPYLNNPVPPSYQGQPQIIRQQPKGADRAAGVFDGFRQFRGGYPVHEPLALQPGTRGK